MNDAQDLHRDIYVGIVAEEMARSGYYGEDITRYGFTAQGQLYTYASEGDCAEAYLLALAAGGQPSLPQAAHKRCASSRWEQALAVEELEAALEEAAQQAPAPFTPRPVDLRPLRDYTKTLPKPRTRAQDAAILGIMTLPTFALRQDERAAVLEVKKSFATPDAARHFFGYYYKDGDSWQPIMNGALPQLLRHWLDAAQRGPVSPILPMHLASTRPIYELRDTFAQLLADTMDAAYLAMLDALYASQGEM